MNEPYIAKEYAMSAGFGESGVRLPSFDKALLAAKVGNYNLVRPSSILPAHCVEVPIEEIKEHVKEGSLLPVAYATISCSDPGRWIASAIAIGFPKNTDDVGVIMEYSDYDITKGIAEDRVKCMVQEGFDARGWEIDHIKSIAVEGVVPTTGGTASTFACVAEW